MRGRLPFLAPAALALLLSACGDGGPAPAPRVVSAPVMPKARPVIRKPNPQAPARPVVQAVPGLEGVIGATSADLARQFGPARLDVWEGDARKLQFAGTACVLDVFLYPPAAGRDPQASYIEARRASDGREVDRAACVAALKGIKR